MREKIPVFIVQIYLVLLIFAGISGCTQSQAYISVHGTGSQAPDVTYISDTGSEASIYPDPEQIQEDKTAPTVAGTLTETKKPLATTAAVTSLTTTAQGTATFFCTGDKCGTLNIQISCNPKIPFTRVAILQMNNVNDAAARTSAIAAMGNNFTEIFPDGSVTPVTLKPGRYVLILLNAGNVEAPQQGGHITRANVTITSGKITKYLFREKC